MNTDREQEIREASAAGLAERFTDNGVSWLLCVVDDLWCALDQARAAGDRLAEIIEAECGPESAGTLCDAALREWRAALGVAETKQEPPR